VNRYLVTLTDGSIITVSAHRYRADGSALVFEVPAPVDDPPNERRWRPVMTLRHADVKDITVATAR